MPIPDCYPNGRGCRHSLWLTECYDTGEAGYERQWRWVRAKLFESIW